jgi:transposase
MKDEMIAEYVEKILPVLPLAKKAYGSRNIRSPQHDASREYTRLLVEFYSKGGSLLKISKALGVTYAGVRRRVVTADLPVTTRQSKSKATPQEVAQSVERIEAAKTYGVEVYHEALRFEYEVNGISLTKIAKAMGLSSANPLYYGVSRTKLRVPESE